MGDRVVLFNSISLKFENDSAFGFVVAPEPVPGKEQHADKTVADAIKDGEKHLVISVQTLQHGIVNQDVLFHTEKECKEYYVDLLGRLEPCD